MRKERCPHGLWGGSDCSVCDNDPPPYHPPAEPKCGRCGHERKEHDRVKDDVMDCFVGVASSDERELCPCSYYRPPTTEPAESEGKGCEHVANSGYHKEFCHKCGELISGTNCTLCLHRKEQHFDVYGMPTWCCDGCDYYRPVTSPTAPPAESVEEALECLEGFGIRLAVEAKSTATKSLRARQCEIRSKAIFTVLDAFKTLESEREQYAAKQIERQTLAIIERFIEEVEKEVIEGYYDPTEARLIRQVIERVKARRSGGEGK